MAGQTATPKSGYTGAPRKSQSRSTYLEQKLLKPKVVRFSNSNFGEFVEA